MGKIAICMFRIIVIIYLTIAATVVYAISEDSSFVAESAASSIIGFAQKQNIKSIAVLPFMCNGNASAPIADAVRDRLIDELVDRDRVKCLDRGELKLVATEASVSCSDGAISMADAVLVGEIFCLESNPVGYVTYRLISVKDCRIIALDFQKVQWNEDEMNLFTDTTRNFDKGYFPLIKTDSLNVLKKKSAKIEGAKVAMVYDGSQRAENNLESRMAYNQVLLTLFQCGVVMFEREFFQEIALENSVNSQVVDGGSEIVAVGHIKPKYSKGESNIISVQMLGVPDGHVLLSVSIKQARGSSSNEDIGNDGDNAFKSRYNDLNKKEKDVKIVYEAEVVIDDDYDPSLYRAGYGLVIADQSEAKWAWRESTHEQKSAVPRNARALFESGLRYIYRSSPRDVDKAKRLLTLGAIYGLAVRGAETDNKFAWYIGPATMCINEIEKSVKVVGRKGGDNFPKPHDFWFYQLDKPLPMDGMVKNELFCYHYTYSIQWRDGLPYKVSAKIDLTPMKDKLLKK